MSDEIFDGTTPIGGWRFRIDRVRDPGDPDAVGCHPRLQVTMNGLGDIFIQGFTWENQQSEALVLGPEEWSWLRRVVDAAYEFHRAAQNPETRR